MYKKFSQECDIPVYEPLCRRLLDDGEGDQSEFMSNQQLVIAPVITTDEVDRANKMCSVTILKIHTRFNQG